MTGSAVEVEIPHGPPAPAGEAPGRGAPAGPRFEQPTRAEFDASVAALATSVKGKIVLAGKAAVVPVESAAPRRGEGGE